MSEAYDRKGIDTLLALDRVRALFISAAALLGIAGLINSDLVMLKTKTGMPADKRDLHNAQRDAFFMTLSDKGKLFVERWKRGISPKALSSRAN